MYYVLQHAVCCGYGVAGVGTTGYDCVIVPGAVKSASPYTGVANQFCGGGGFAVINAGTAFVTVCSKLVRLG